MTTCKCNLCGSSMAKAWDKSRMSHSIAAACALLLSLFMLLIFWPIALGLFVVFCIVLKSPKRILLCGSCGHYLPCHEQRIGTAGLGTLIVIVVSLTVTGYAVYSMY